MDKGKLGGLLAVTLTLTVAVAVAAPATAAGPVAPAGTEARTPEPAEGRKHRFPKLRMGDRGDAVTAAQRLLVAHGHPTTVDGIFGPRTLGRVRELQVDGGLPVTGIIDVVTWERLIMAARRGERGERVRVLQWLLTFHGFPLVADGIFGASTQEATRAYQRKWRLAPSGVVDTATWRVLVAEVKT